MPSPVLSTYLQALATNADGPDSTINVAPLTPGTNIISRSVTVAPGDTIMVRVAGAIVQNSGATKTLGGFVSMGSLNVSFTENAATASSASNRAVRSIVATFGVKNSSSAWLEARFNGYSPAALGAGGVLSVNLSGGGSQQSTANLTGVQTINVSMFSNVATPTQNYELTSWTITKIATNP